MKIKNNLMPEKDQPVFKPGKRKYIYSVGRRKSASAQLRLYPKGAGKISVNDIPFADYFQNPLLERAATEPLNLVNLRDDYDASVVVKGGGKKGQADAIKLAFARALLADKEDLKPQIKKAGLLTRDARVKERKKYGLKGARRAPQWSKR